MSLKGGYQPTKKNVELKVNKNKPNVLDKLPTKKLASTGSKESTPSPPASPSPLVSSALNSKVDELVSELHKLKAIILKHEVRIRDLEKKVEQQEKSDNLTEIKSNGDSTNLLPDEV